METYWRIELFGAFRAHRPGGVVDRFRSRKIAALLAWLALHENRTHPREELIELFWPGSEPDAGRQNLSQALSSLRHQFEPPGVPAGTFLRASRAEIHLNPDAFRTDVGEFESALREAQNASSETTREQALRSAVSIYRGELLPGLFDDWILRERDRLAEAYLHAAERLICRSERIGDTAAALELARSVVRADPLRENGHRLLIALLAATGQRTSAIRQYQALKRRLRSELDVAPEPETEELIRRVRNALPVTHEATGASSGRVATRTRARARPSAMTLPLPGTITFLAGVAETNDSPRLRARLLELGHEVSWTKDEFVVAFPRAGDAAHVAISAMRSLLTETCGEPSRPSSGLDRSAGLPHVRMALHTGEVTASGSLRESIAAQHAIHLALAARDGQILSSDTTASLLRRRSEQDLPLEDLGIYRVRTEDDPERIHLIRVPEMLQHDFPPLDAKRPYLGNLPLRFTRFFGRQEDLDQLRNQLEDPDRRLTTLTGPGGTGKTRLAIELVSQLLDSFPAGIWFVPLADLTDPRQIPNAILQTLRLRAQAGQDALEQVASSVRGARSLFLFDNFEHLVSGGAGSVAALLEKDPLIHCLVTSRHRLGLAAEREYPLLPLPTPAGTETPERLMKLPSVQLFVDRAQMVLPDFQVTRGNAAAVARICARLEGIPLALELAAARVQVLAPSQLLQRLSHRLDFLVSRRNDLAARHRTLRAAMDWSYRLLDPDIQRFFSRLSVFHGSWTADAAEEVCGEPLALDYLTQLRDFSLIQTFEGAHQMRFRMLDTIREYAAENVPANERRELGERHLGHYLALAEEAEGHLNTRDRQFWLDRLSFEAENFHAALNESVLLPREARTGSIQPHRQAGHPMQQLRERDQQTQERQEPAQQYPAESDSKNVALGLRLAGALADFWQMRGSAPEGYEHLVRLLSLSDHAETSVRSKALDGAGNLASVLGDLSAAEAFFERSLSLRRTMADDRGIATTIGNLGNVAFFQGNLVKARQHYERCLEMRRTLGNRLHIARALHNLGNLANAEGNFIAARAHLEESLAIKREFDDPWDIAGTLQSLGNVAANLKAYPVARAHYEASLTARRRVKDRQGIAYTLGNLALVVSAEGDLATAFALHQESLSIKRELHDRRGILSSITNLGGLAHRMGDDERAARLLAAASELRRSTGSSLAPGEQAKHDAAVAEIRDNLTDLRFDAAWNAGRILGEADAIAYALETKGA